jgi:hypothetical protein
MFNINDFKSRGLTKGGARPSLFDVVITTPFGAESGALEKFRFTCRASEIPAATIGSVDVPYFGRKIKLAGDREFADWPVTVMNDEDYLVRNMFEDWSNRMNQLVGNIKIDGALGNSYKTTALVSHFSKDGAQIRSYEFVGIFPISVGVMGLDWDNTNSIQTFDVSFAYDYWRPIGVGGTGINTGDSAR